jgi:hypothetical protein
MSKNFDLKAHADLVLSFERDFQAKLASLAQIEKDIDRLSQLRGQWLQGLTSVDSKEETLFGYRLKILRVKAELVSSELLTDIARLESVYEAQTLTYLIEATKPAEPSDYSREDHKMNEMSRKALMNKSLEKLKSLIRESIAHRSRLASSIVDMQMALDRLKVEYKSNYHLAIARIRNQLQEFMAATKSKEEKSRENHRSIMSDYLVLRHNARFAQEKLVRSRNEALTARQSLAENYQQFALRISNDRILVEGSARDELKLVVDEMRRQLLLKEAVVEDYERDVLEDERQTKDRFAALQGEWRSYERKYLQLQRKRSEEVVAMDRDVKSLRETIERMEANMIAAS